MRDHATTYVAAQEAVRERIYFVRGQRVMFGADFKFKGRKL